MRLLLGVVVGTIVSALACESTTPCDPSYPVVHLEVSTGRASVSSYALSGACGGSGTGADCQVVTCGSNGPCPCLISVPITRQNPSFTPPTTICHIEVVSVDGGVFTTDVDTVNRSSDCINWSLADSSQSIIAVQFAGGGDGGAADAGR